jgi:hypothetical protein
MKLALGLVLKRHRARKRLTHGGMVYSSTTARRVIRAPMARTSTR